MSLEKLKEKSKELNYPQETIDERENGRLSFITKFPLDKIKDLSIDEYVQGTDENSFCYWLEFKNILFGIGGGNASKFGVYKAKGNIYYTSFGKNKKQLTGSELDEFFSNLKKGILQALNFAANNEIEKIKDIDIPLWNMVLQKILSLYYPEKFLTIGSSKVLLECARDIHIKGMDLTPKNSIQINYECKKKLSSLPEFREWHYDKLGTFIWKVYSEKVKQNNLILEESEPYITTKKPKPNNLYWLYSPGENARLWDEFYEEGIMALGWDDIGDLNNYKNRDEIRNALIDAFGGEGSKRNDVSANDDFLNKMKVGDVIIAKKGRGELLGYGIVTSNYKYDDNRTEYKQTRKVDWVLKGNWEVDFSLVLKTLTDITRYKSDDPKYKKYYEELLGIMKDENGMENSQTQKQKQKIIKKFPLNTILYGPPGTGKTYNTILRAAEIIENRQIDSYDDALKIFKTKLHDQIEFITFHQNYSYEDFIQGLRPDIREENEQLKFRKSDGVFKVIADRALLNLKESKKPPEEINQSKAFDEALENLKDQVLESTKAIKINETAYFTAAEDDAFRYSGDNWTLNDKGFNGFRMKYSDLQRFFEEDIKERKEVKNLTNISGLAKQHATYFIKAYELVKSLMPQVSKIPERIDEKNYVIIIDEINRANISRVFGELITLIEPDKRSHGTIPLEARLPSGDPFVVPSNLYIIGTMNTADKSIALLDIALRRRFEFEAMYPKYSEDGLHYKDENILRSINKSIKSKKGHDFQIGHSYFMDSNEDPYELKRRINVKVIPLLLEYFMNDSNTVAEIITEALVGTNFGIEENSWPLKITDLND